jgi:hypothetical protein
MWAGSSTSFGSCRAAMARITRDRIAGVLGAAPKPEKVWEKQFDYFDDALVRLSQTDWDKVPDEDFWYYILDLSNVDLQPDLFRHLFPACLKYWYETLMRGEDRVEAQGDLSCDPGSRIANAWISRFNSLGIVAPVIGQIWDDWWMLNHPGKTRCAVMYASGLVYLKGENPIYGAWTPEQGGGGPYLTQSDSSIFDRAWRDDNLAFLKAILSVDYVTARLGESARKLEAYPEAKVASQVANDAKRRADVIELRIGDLLENLARVPPEQDWWDK